ncbi:MAG TPA: hypothetical protein PK892_11550, partial [Bacteroidales bacterium]|nr:hypothetical protein [Bacteroidales bacterium]
VARWAHNPKVEGSNPSPATTNPDALAFGIFLFREGRKLVCGTEAEKKKTVSERSERKTLVVYPTNQGINIKTVIKELKFDHV